MRQGKRLGLWFGDGNGFANGVLSRIPRISIVTLNPLPENAAVGTVAAVLTVSNPEDGVNYTLALPPDSDGAFTLVSTGVNLWEQRVADSALIHCEVIQALNIQPISARSENGDYVAQLQTSDNETVTFATTTPGFEIATVPDGFATVDGEFATVDGKWVPAPSAGTMPGVRISDASVIDISGPSVSVSVTTNGYPSLDISIPIDIEHLATLQDTANADEQLVALSVDDLVNGESVTSWSVVGDAGLAKVSESGSVCDVLVRNPAAPDFRDANVMFSVQATTTLRAVTFPVAVALQRTSTLIDVSTYGVLPDQDSASALIAMRNALIAADRSAHYRLYFPPGDYYYSNNRWLYGLERVTIEAYGCTFKSSYSLQSNAGDSVVFSRQDGIFNHKGDRELRGGGAWISGDLISTMTPGASVVSFVNAGDSAGYAIGDLVLVHSFCQQGEGYSPNVRYFDFREVSAVGAGTVTLDGGVTRVHSSDYPDIVYDSSAIFGQPGVVSFGKARILKLSNRDVDTGGPYFYHRFIAILGLTVEQNDNYPSQTNALTMSALECRFRDLTTVGLTSHLFVRESRGFYGKNLAVGGVIEVDKVCTKCLLDDGSAVTSGGVYHAIKSGTGVDDLEVKAFNFTGGMNVIAQNEARLLDCSVDTTAESDSSTVAGVRLYNGTWGGERVVIENLSHTKLANQKRIELEYGATNEYVVEAVSGSSLLVSRPNFGVQSEEVPNIVESGRPGMPIFEADGITLIGSVDQVIEGSGNTYQIDLIVTGSMPSVSDTVTYQPVHEVVEDGVVLLADPIA